MEAIDADRGGARRAKVTTKALRDDARLGLVTPARVAAGDRDDEGHLHAVHRLTAVSA